MLIKNNQIYNQLNLLESMQYIEPINSPAMVPVIENTEIGANIVALEDIMKFAESNGIDDLGYALGCVCEASNVDTSTMAFSIQEENLIGYQYYSDIVQDILSENVCVYVSPISRHSDVFQLAETAISYLENYDDDCLLEAFVNNDFRAFCEDDNTVDKIPKTARRVAGKFEDFEDGEYTAEDWYYDEKNNQWYNKTTRQYFVPGKPKDPSKATDSWLKKLKQNAIDKPRDWIAKQIAALNQKMRDFIAKAEQADPKKKGIFMKIKEKIARAIEWLTRKLANAVRREKDTVTGRIEPLNQR